MNNSQVRMPPASLLLLLAFLVPGMILAGSVVGSGELIATTLVGALAGIWLLWVILVGCLIKYPVQVEFTRYSICTGQGTIEALNTLPGPRFLGTHWVLWFWLLMFLSALGQLGGIAHGCGQALAMGVPVTGDYKELLVSQDEWDAQAAEIGKEKMQQARPSRLTMDEVIWATACTLLTMALLWSGRYSIVGSVSTFLVIGFTLITVVCVVVLQFRPEWAVTLKDLANGLSFRLPPALEGMKKSPLSAAFATFGIIGMGATDIIGYLYWLKEAGYTASTGPRDESEEWAKRARAWLWVAKIDAGVSMALYTFATVAFYLLGAMVLYPQGLRPAGDSMIKVLSEMYVPVLGAIALPIFIVGSFFVLYSTHLAGIATHSRVCAKAVSVFGVGAKTEEARKWWVRAFGFGFPLFSLLLMLVFKAPVSLILFCGVMQTLMLPLLGSAVLYFMHKKCDERVKASSAWKCVVWLAVIGLWIFAIGAVVTAVIEGL